MNPATNANLSRHSFAGGGTFAIAARHGLAHPSLPPATASPSPTISPGRHGQAITMEVMDRPDTEFVAVCDRKCFSEDYVEYSENGPLKVARRLPGADFETWGEHLLATSGRGGDSTQLIHFTTGEIFNFAARRDAIRDAHRALVAGPHQTPPKNFAQREAIGPPLPLCY